MVCAILFHFCDSYFITYFLHPAVYQGVVFDTQCLEIAKTITYFSWCFFHT